MTNLASITLVYTLTFVCYYNQFFVPPILLILACLACYPHAWWCSNIAERFLSQKLPLTVFDIPVRSATMVMQSVWQGLREVVLRVLRNVIEQVMLAIAGQI